MYATPRALFQKSPERLSKLLAITSNISIISYWTARRKSRAAAGAVAIMDSYSQWKE